jgi:hypothetical protein
VYLASAVLLVVLLELLALDGRAFHYLGITLRGFQAERVGDPRLLDTLTALTLNGMVFYAAASLLDRRASEHVNTAAAFLFTIAPFAMLHPLGYLVRTGDYSVRFDWIYAVCAGCVIVLSHRRQRRSFYYAGLLNLGVALYLVADHRQWFGRPGWAVALIVTGLLALGAGLTLDRSERRR